MTVLHQHSLGAASSLRSPSISSSSCTKRRAAAAPISSSSSSYAWILPLRLTRIARHAFPSPCRYACTASAAAASSSYPSSSLLHSEEEPLSLAIDARTVVCESSSSAIIKEDTVIFDDCGDEEKMTFKGMLKQMRDIFFFVGPVLGIWLFGPLMSLIDTAVVGNSSSLELAALGPGTVFCDQVGYVFMFLSVATSNLIASSLAKQDKSEAARYLSALLSVALACGLCMLIITSVFSGKLLEAFVGPENARLLPATCSYVKIRGLAWPIALVGLVAQSASLGMQDSWSPLKILGIASIVNAIGDMLLCTFFKFGLAGAAWATTLSQYVGGFLMLQSLYVKGYNPLDFCIPSIDEFWLMIKLAGPVVLTMLSKVSFYTFVTYLTTSLGTLALAGHQVMVGLYTAVSVPAEALCQTAQSFMPALIQGPNPKLRKARFLLKSLLVIGMFNALILGIVTICIPWMCPQLFTRDIAVIGQMRMIAIPLLFGQLITHPLLALEGTLLAGRDLQFLSLSMVSCFTMASSMLVISKMLGFGLQGYWWTMVCFQLIRFLMASSRLSSEKSILSNDF